MNTSSLSMTTQHTQIESLLRSSLRGEQIGKQIGKQQSELSGDPLNWNYCDEYPLVLSPQHFQEHSHIIEVDNQIVAHASLLIRTLSSHHESSKFQIGLIGNVATHKNYRGRGLQKELFNNLEKFALSRSVNLLVLWSELNVFYQKLGFSSIGQEHRYLILSERLKSRFSATNMQVSLTHRDQLDHQTLETLLKLRPATDFIVDRSTEEFHILLGIPNTNLFLLKFDKKLVGYFVISRGSDMINVVHEWGVIKPDYVPGATLQLLQATGIEELTFLVPSALPGVWHRQFATLAQSCEKHPIALAKSIAPNDNKAFKALCRGFIWGLDSI